MVASLGVTRPAYAAASDFVLTLNASDLGLDPAVLRQVVPQIQADIRQDGGLSASIKQDAREHPAEGDTLDVSALPNFDGTVTLTPDGAGMTITVAGGQIQTTAGWSAGFVALLIGALAGFGLRVLCVGVLASTGVGAATIPLVCTPLGGAVTAFVASLVNHAFIGDLNKADAWTQIMLWTLAGLAVGFLWEKYLTGFAKNYLPGALKKIGSWILTKVPTLRTVFGASAAVAAEDAGDLAIEMEEFLGWDMRSWGTEGGQIPDQLPPPSVGRTYIRGADPSMVKVGDTYYSVQSGGGDGIFMRSATSLAGLSSSPPRRIWANPGLAELWAPEITVIGGRYYVYFSTGAGAAHRMFVISSSSPASGYGSHQKLNLPDDRWAIDGAAFTFNSQLWFVWSGWEGGSDGEQNLYLSRMSNSTTPTGQRFRISQPRESWERVVGNPTINEGPEVIVDPNGQLHIVYSANGSWSDQYCLGDLRLKKGGDPTYVWDWYKSNGCVLGSNPQTMMSGFSATKNVNGPGHHNFALLNGDVANGGAAGSRVPFMYHGVPEGMNYGWENRVWYEGAFTWWNNIPYARQNVPGDTVNSGYSLGMIEDPKGQLPAAPTVTPPSSSPAPQPPTTGPIKNADPSVIRVGSTYYSMETGDGDVYSRSASTPAGLSSAGRRLVFASEKNMPNLWAPEVVKIGSTYALYFASGDGQGGQRMYYSSSPYPDRGFSNPVPLRLPDDRWAVDGTAFTFNDQLWFVWSGWEGDTNGEQNLYLAKMSGPSMVTGPRYRISQPREAFERATGNPFVNEAPQPIKDPNGQLHIVYSANGSWSNDYCMADLRLRKGGDPTYVWDWYKSNGCQFGSHRETMASGWDPTLYLDGPGSHSFVLLNGDINTSPPAGPQFPLMYHAVPKGTPYSWANRQWFAGTFTWWGDSTYSRQNVPGANADTGYGLKFFEAEPTGGSPGELEINNADPSVLRVGGTYYSVEASGSFISVRAAEGLARLSLEPPSTIFLGSGMSEVWAPEIVRIDGRFYIYFSAGAGASHRMYVMSSPSPTIGYGTPQRMALPNDRWAVDGTAFRFDNQLWFVWSGWEGDSNVEQNIYLAKMSSPTTTTGSRFAISQPRESWEKVVANPAVNEAPQPIKDPNGQLHIAYSANGSWSDQYCLGDLRLKKGGDATYVWDWYKSNGCLFGSNRNSMMAGWDPTLWVNGPGSHSFVLLNGDIGTSPPAGQKFPLMFHAVPKGTAYSWGARRWHTGAFMWWGDITYSRANVPGANSDTGWSLKYFEE